MRKYLIVLILLIYGLSSGLISCNKTDPTENSLVGIWESTKVDTLAQYKKPVKPDTFRSSDYKNRTIEIKDDGSFKMIDTKGTINGNWVQTKSDSLRLTVYNIQGNYPINSKIEFVDNNNLTLNYSTVYSEYVLFTGGSSPSLTKEILYDIKVHYIRK